MSLSMSATASSSAAGSASNSTTAAGAEPASVVADAVKRGLPVVIVRQLTHGDTVVFEMATHRVMNTASQQHELALCSSIVEVTEEIESRVARMPDGKEVCIRLVLPAMHRSFQLIGISPVCRKSSGVATVVNMAFPDSPARVSTPQPVVWVTAGDLLPATPLPSNLKDIVRGEGGAEAATAPGGSAAGAPSAATGAVDATHNDAGPCVHGWRIQPETLRLLQFVAKQIQSDNDLQVVKTVYVPVTMPTLLRLMEAKTPDPASLVSTNPVFGNRAVLAYEWPRAVRIAAAEGSALLRCLVLMSGSELKRIVQLGWQPGCAPDGATVVHDTSGLCDVLGNWCDRCPVAWSHPVPLDAAGTSSLLQHHTIAVLPERLLLWTYVTPVM